MHTAIVLAAQSVEGLHDDPAERDRLLNCASTLIGHRLADPDPIVTRAGSIKRAERTHQLDSGGATGMGSLRLQDAYRIDPNQLRSLPTGVAWIVTGGRAAKVAVARAGQAPLAGSPRRGAGDTEVVGPGDPALGRPGGDDVTRRGQTLPVGPSGHELGTSAVVRPGDVALERSGGDEEDPAGPPVEDDIVSPGLL